MIEWKHLWFAYSLDIFDDWLEVARETWDFPSLPFSREAFIRVFRFMLEQGEFYLLSAPVRREDANAPVGIVVVDRKGHRIEPHVLWFPWATPRNKLEAIIAFIDGTRGDNLLLLYIEEEFNQFFQHIARRGLLRGRGFKVYDFFGPGKTARFWQSTRGG